MRVTKQLDGIIASAVIAVGLEYVGCVRHQNLLRVYIDKKQGVTVEDCERASRQINAVLEVEKLPVRGHYTLEVTSPGIERPLFNEEDYRRFVGRKAQVVLKNPLNERRKFIGNIAQVAQGQLTLMTDAGRVTLPITAIHKANLMWDPEGQ